MKQKVTLTGINIQFPISRLILAGEKVMETRTYPIPEQYVKKRMYLVETPGKSGKFRSRIVAYITFDRSFPYPDAAAFYNDLAKHCVSRDSPWAWVEKKKKWGWPIISIMPLKYPRALTKRPGIRFTKNL